MGLHIVGTFLDSLSSLYNIINYIVDISLFHYVISSHKHKNITAQLHKHKNITTQLQPYLFIFNVYQVVFPGMNGLGMQA